MDYTLDKALKEVQKVIKEESGLLKTMEPEGLFGPVKYTLDLGGKRLRPLIVRLVQKAYNPKGALKDAAPLMKAVELFHNFSLIHDDLMDDAPIRRGKPTVYKKWGSSQAVLSGDAMLIEAYACLGKAKPELLPVYLKVFNDMATGVCAGQQKDMEFEDKELTEITMDDYLEMVSSKTAVLLVTSAMLGAILGGIDDAEEGNLLTEAFVSFGTAFQVMDDYLDAFSDVIEFGKLRGGDILEGKKTFLLLHAYKKAPEEVERILALEDDDLKVSEMIKLYQSTNADTTALDFVDWLTGRSIAALADLSADTTLLQELIRSQLNRRS